MPGELKPILVTRTIRLIHDSESVPEEHVLRGKQVSEEVASAVKYTPPDPWGW